jgi:hypothetical protein
MKRYTEKWWRKLVDGMGSTAESFNDGVIVYSEMAVRAIVYNALNESAPQQSVQADAICRCESPDIAWNYNHTKWVCIFCGEKGTA